jgi:hypothetical protein
MITQKELLENLLYDKDTGIFTRKISLNTKVRVGDVAGGKDTKGYVCIRVAGKTYKAQIRFDGRWKHLGCYETEHEAHAAYLSAKIEAHMKAREA